jgi:hypothetical protein
MPSATATTTATATATSIKRISQANPMLCHLVNMLSSIHL